MGCCSECKKPLRTMENHDCPVIRRSRAIERRANVELVLFIVVLLFIIWCSRSAQ